MEEGEREEREKREKRAREEREIREREKRAREEREKRAREEREKREKRDSLLADVSRFGDPSSPSFLTSFTCLFSTLGLLGLHFSRILLHNV